MPRVTLVCDRCGKEYSIMKSRIQSKYHHFCSKECSRKSAKLICSVFDEDTRRRAGERITHINRTLLNQPQYVQKSADAKRGKGEGKSYPKMHQQHLHRIIAEQMLRRPLAKGEIVHHKDGNKFNNDPSNLEVMTQSEHIRIHLREGGGRLVPNVQPSRVGISQHENE